MKNLFSIHFYQGGIKDKNIEWVFLMDIYEKSKLIQNKYCRNLYPSLLNDEDAFKRKEPEILEDGL